MSLLSRRRLRWGAPVAALAGALLVAGGLPGTSASADEHPTLPARTAAQLLASLQGVQVAGLSGTVVQTSHLGLPQLPGADGGDATLSLQSFASGSRTLRVWADGPERQRVALLGQLAESDVVRNGSDVWTYSSATRDVTHLALPSETAAAPSDASATPEAAMTPQQAAQEALKAIDPTTAVTVDRTARIAGRPAYQLVLTPRDSRSLVGRVQIALDSATSLPLRAQVFGRTTSTPALEVGFTSLSLKTPARSVFSFTPPKGSAVTQRSLPGSADATGQADAGKAGAAASPQASGTRVLGAGWTSVLVVPASSATTASTSSGLLDRLTTRVPGGRLITSALVSVLLADDGTLYVGAVRGADLQRVAATGQGL